MRLEHTYLGKLWRQKRRLFWLMIFMIAGHLSPIYLNFQFLTPFYLWSMYTMPMPAVDTFQAFTIRYNEGGIIARPHTYRDLGKMMWMYTLPKYNAYLKTGDTLPCNTRSSNLLTGLLGGLPHSQPIHVTNANLQDYPAWLKRYLEQEKGVSIYKLEVLDIKLVYGKDGRPYPVGRQNYLRYP